MSDPIRVRVFEDIHGWGYEVFNARGEFMIGERGAFRERDLALGFAFANVQQKLGAHAFADGVDLKVDPPLAGK